MNFNRGGAPSNNLTPQQLAAQRQRMQLPPQLQNLTPQQLQELRNKPQFQNMLRQYYQRQQMAQQQMSQQSNARGNAAPSTAYGDRGAMGQNAGSPSANINLATGSKGMMADPAAMSGNLGLLAGITGASMSNPNLSQQMVNRDTQAAFASQQGGSQQNFQRSAISGMNAGGMNAALSGMPGAAVSGQQKYASQIAQLRLMPPNATPNPNMPPFINSGVQPGMKPLDPAFVMKGGQPGSTPTPSGFVKEKIKVPPQFAPDALSHITLTPLTSLNEWSEKLKQEGKEVPLDVKLYEDVIKKDDFFLRKTLLQNQSSKELLEKMARDIKSYAQIKQLRMGAINAATKGQYSNSIWGEGYLGYGNGVTNSSTQVVLPLQNKCFLKPGQLAVSDAEMNKNVLKNIASNSTRQLVPIRLEFDQERDRFKLRDTFLWDLNDKTYPIEVFLRNLVDDYSFISEVNFQTILLSVNEQIKEYRSKPTNAVGEIRIPIKIDLLISNTQYTDQFEWDILSDKENDPEEFATILCDEMSLPGEFATAIAFSIREQSQMYYKALSLVGYSFDGSYIREDEIKSHMAPPLRIHNAELGQDEDFITTLRTPTLLAEYSPAINRITQLEIEKIERELERDSRRRRRHNNEGAFSYNENGPNLFGSLGRGTASRRTAPHSSRGVKTTIPDLSDVPKTFRTPLPSSVLPGGIDLGAPDINGYNELVINRSQIANPDYKPPAPPGMVSIYKDSAGSFFVKIKSRRLR